MTATILYVSAAMLISVLLFILAFYALTRKRGGGADLVTIGPGHFDVPLWQGKVKKVVHDDHVHETEMDVIVYSKSIFMGFASQGFPFVHIDAEDIVRVRYQRHSVSIQVKGTELSSSYITVSGAGEKELLHFARKAEFIGARVKKPEK